MTEYIAKEQVVEWFRPYGHTDEGIPFDVLSTDISGMLAADVAQVVHGKWIPLGKRVTIFECSVCNKCEPHISEYCPNCGAKMDEWRCKQ